jgi:Methyltransferase domain
MDDVTAAWLDGLERRHLADLTISEVARALRALSSCYVERRSKLAEGSALASKGKRAAFALFYGPLHFFITQAIVRSIPGAIDAVTEIVDLGCGTGAAGAAWAHEAGARRVRAFDRHPWAIDEAAAAYRLFHWDARAVQRDISSPRFHPDALHAHAGAGVIAAYTANELPAPGRTHLLSVLLAARRQGARVLVIEPIARRGIPWWDNWQAAFTDAGGRADEWRFPSDLPQTQKTLARAAGLDPRELTARSLFA